MQLGRELQVGLVDEMLVRREEGRAQDSVVPVENDARLANLGFVLLAKPDFIVCESGEELVTNLLVRSRRRAQIRLVSWRLTHGRGSPKA